MSNKRTNEQRTHAILQEFKSFCENNEDCDFSLKREQVALKIIDAFLDTTLGNGIGFFEADCRDDYISDSTEYNYWRNQDERVYWENMYVLAHKDIRPKRFIQFSAFTFMDNIGRKFALPCYLLWELERNGNVDLANMTQRESCMKDLELNKAQKQAVMATLNFLYDEAFTNNWNMEYEDFGKSILCLQKLWSD